MSDTIDTAIDTAIGAVTGIAGGLGARIRKARIGRMSALAVAAVRHVREWRRRRAGMAELMRMDDHRLKDIGLSRADLHAMAQGRFTVHDSGGR